MGSFLAGIIQAEYIRCCFQRGKGKKNKIYPVKAFSVSSIEFFRSYMLTYFYFKFNNSNELLLLNCYLKIYLLIMVLIFI